MKSLKLGELSMSGEAVDKFESLYKEEQISYLSDRLSPSNDRVRAEKLLKGVKHGGNISKGNEAEATGGNTNGRGEGAQDSAEKPGSDSSKAAGTKAGAKS